MTCPSCAWGVEYALKQKDGRGKVVYDASRISKEEILATIKPYNAKIVEERKF